jgi:hypothetical protein
MSNPHQDLLEWLADRHGTLTFELAITRHHCYIKWPVEEGWRVILGIGHSPQVALRKAIISWRKNHEDMAR